MSNETQHQSGCSEQYAELCALSTTGELSGKELEELEAHLTECSACTDLLMEYNSLARIGMAKLAPEIEPKAESLFSQRERKAEHRLTAALYTVNAAELSPASAIHLPTTANARSRSIPPAFFIGAAAVLLIGVGGAFEAGQKMTKRRPPEPPLVSLRPEAPVGPDTEKADLRERLAAAQSLLTEVTARSDKAEQQIAELSNTKTSLLAQIEELSKRDHDSSATLTATAAQRDGLQQQLNDTSKTLEQVREDLIRTQRDRQGTLLRVASLEQEVNSLHATMTVAAKADPNDATLLAADRDIRELMGARQLYIADVFDVQNDGERSKPFGRVFYTKGKRLVFYAFDLQAQPGYRDAKAFQAWGKPDSTSDKPISLGIFYMDNEKNRRWVLKSENPDVLARINAVFVTVEPQGGSSKPTGKPFLEAYLHTLPPNHP